MKQEGRGFPRYLRFLKDRLGFLKTYTGITWSWLHCFGYYRYISLLITSALYLSGPPPSPLYLKAGVCFCLLWKHFYLSDFTTTKAGAPGERNSFSL